MYWAVGAGEIALFGDLGVKGIDKGYAIDVLLEELGASIEDTIAFGDAKIDIPMLEKCAVGVAVATPFIWFDTGYLIRC